MFTGIVKTTGHITSVERRGGDARVRVTAPGFQWSDYAVGESIAVNGVCLTAVAMHQDGFDADVSTETLAVTTLGNMEAGVRVNLEPALAVGERMGGHIVTGHVDGVGKVLSRETAAGSVRFEVQVPDELSRYIARKGSVSVDGVSLTVNQVTGDSFGITIVPHTLQGTIIDEYRAGSAVNIEVDMLARYLERLLGSSEAGGITAELLKAHGYG